MSVFLSIFDEILDLFRGEQLPKYIADRYNVSISNIYKFNDDTILEFIVPSRSTFSVVISTDNFTKEKTLKMNAIMGMYIDKLPTYADDVDYINLDFGFKNVAGIDFITFGTYQKNLKLKQGDKFEFLFADNEIISFSIRENAYQVDKDSGGIIVESNAIIPIGNLDKFREIATVGWRYTPVSGGKQLKGSLKNFSKIILEMTRVYMHALENPVE